MVYRPSAILRNMIKTGDIIKQARLQRKLTQYELASKIAYQVRDSYSRAALSQVENGDTKDMKPANLFAACKILGIDPQAAVAGKLKWVDTLTSETPPEASSSADEALPDQISMEEQELISSFRCLTKRQRSEILLRAQDFWHSNQEVINEWKLRGTTDSP